MTASRILLANSKNLATDERTETIGGKSVQTHVQKVQVESTATTAAGVAPQDALFDFIAVSGGSSEDMNVDGSSTTAVFEYVVPAGKQVLLARVNFQIVDNGTPTFTEFGTIPALTNGVVIRAVDSDDTVLKQFTNNSPIKSNGDFGYLAGVDLAFYVGTGDDGVLVRWSLSKALDGDLLLTAGQKFQILIQDNLTGVTRFKALLQGRILDA